jgi:hypothetical protein
VFAVLRACSTQRKHFQLSFLPSRLAQVETHFTCTEAGTSEPEAKRAKKESEDPEAEVEEDEGKKKEPGTKGLVEGNFDDDDEEDEDFAGALSAVSAMLPFQDRGNVPEFAACNCHNLLAGHQPQSHFVTHALCLRMRISLCPSSPWGRNSWGRKTIDSIITATQNTSPHCSGWQRISAVVVQRLKMRTMTTMMKTVTSTGRMVMTVRKMKRLRKKSAPSERGTFPTAHTCLEDRTFYVFCHLLRSCCCFTGATTCYES